MSQLINQSIDRSIYQSIINESQLLKLDENLLEKLKNVRIIFIGSLHFSVQQTSTTTRTNDYRMFTNSNLDIHWNKRSVKVNELTSSK